MAATYDTSTYKNMKIWQQTAIVRRMVAVGKYVSESAFGCLCVKLNRVERSDLPGVHDNRYHGDFRFALRG